MELNSCHSERRYPPTEAYQNPKTPTLCTLRGGQNPTLCEIPSYAKHLCPPMTAGTFGLPLTNKKTSDFNAVHVYLKDGSVHTIPPGAISD